MYQGAAHHEQSLLSCRLKYLERPPDVSVVGATTSVARQEANRATPWTVAVTAVDGSALFPPP